MDKTQALQLVVDWADCGIAETIVSIAGSAGDCAKIRKAIDIIAEAAGVNPAAITTDLIDSCAVVDGDYDE